MADFTPGWGEEAVEFLSGAIVRGILIVIFLQCLYIVLHAPGHGVAEVCGLVALVLMLGVPLLTGYAQWWEILVIFLGLLLVSLEIVLPGHIFPGLTGGVLVLFGLVMTFVPAGFGGPSYLPNQTNLPLMEKGLLVVAAAMGSSIFLWFWLGRFLPKMPLLNRLILTNFRETPSPQASQPPPPRRVQSIGPAPARSERPSPNFDPVDRRNSSIQISPINASRSSSANPDISRPEPNSSFEKLLARASWCARKIETNRSFRIIYACDGRPLEIFLYIVYLAIGPGLWILFALGMASSRSRMNLLNKSAEPIPQPSPNVTIIIPAKDEGERIRQCLSSVLAQDYPRFDVLAVDDRSSDATGRVMDEMAAADPRMKVLHIEELPVGWTGKNNALFRAASRADGQWLLFIDSDVVLQPPALSTTLRIALARRYDMLSLILRQETRGIWESALVPIASAAFGTAYMMGLSNSESNNCFFGNGQYMLFNRKIYDQIGGHEAVKSQFNEDMTLARLMKQSGLRPRMAWGTDYGSVRMYDSLPTIMKGWSRIFFGSSSGSPWRSVAVMFFIVIGCYSALFAAAWALTASDTLSEFATASFGSPRRQFIGY